MRIKKERPTGPPEPVFVGRDVVLVAVFATWCKPCAKEVPMLNRLAAEVAGRGLRIVGVSADRASPKQVAAWLGRKKVAYPAFYGDVSVQLGTSVLGDVSVLPLLVLLSPRGRVLRRWSGALPEAILRAAIEPLLDRKRR